MSGALVKLIVCFLGVSSLTYAGPLDSCETENQDSRTAPLKGGQLPWLVEAEQTLQCRVSLFPAVFNPKPPGQVQIPRSPPLATQVLRVSSGEAVTPETKNFGIFFKEHSHGASRETWLELHGRMDPRPRREQAQFSLLRRSRRGGHLSRATPIGKTQIIRGKGSTELSVEGYRLEVQCALEGESGYPVDGRGGG
jgi:hypothetical protein